MHPFEQCISKVLGEQEIAAQYLWAFARAHPVDVPEHLMVCFIAAGAAHIHVNAVSVLGRDAMLASIRSAWGNGWTETSPGNWEKTLEEVRLRVSIRPGTVCKGGNRE